MINPKLFINTLKKNDINFYTGVPDSLMMGFCSTIEKYKNHTISTSEGSAVGLGIGYYLAKKKIPLIYLQNSGLGNIVNPVLSLVNKKVYKIPIFFLIGWRGETHKKKTKKSKKDEPQHISQGEVTEKLLKVLNIKYKIIDQKSNYKKLILELKKYAVKKSEPVALLVRKNTFEKSNSINSNKNNKLLKRQEILNIIMKNITRKIHSVSTTGVLSRELMELAETKNKINNFYCVGGMGHAISIASGIASVKKNKKILCLDGDGAALMHLGAQAISGSKDNIIHIIINNNSHDSVGGQKTASENVKFSKISQYIGYKNFFYCLNEQQIKKSIKKSINSKGSCLIEIKSSLGYKKNLMRPKESMIYLRDKFIKNLK